LSIDEAVNVAQGVSSGNAQTVSFWLLPQWHNNAAKQATLKHRRLLEDKIIQRLVGKNHDGLYTTFTTFTTCCIDIY